MRHKLVYISIRILFILSAIALILTAKGWRYDFTQRTFIRTGILDVHSRPNGSQIMLGSDDYGLTPKKIPSLTPGRYQLTVTKTNYYPWQKNVTIYPELVTQMFDIILFPMQIELQPIEQLLASNIDLDEKNGYISTINPESETLVRLSIYTTGFNRLSEYLLPADLQNNASVEIHWSPESRYAIANFFTRVNEKKNLQYSYYIDSKNMTAQPRELTIAESFRSSRSALLAPVWHPVEPAVFLTDTNQTLMMVRLDDGEVTEVLTTGKNVQPLFCTPASGLFGKARLYYSNSASATDMTLRFTELPSDETSKDVASLTISGDISSIILSNDRNNVFLGTPANSEIITNLTSDSPNIKHIPQPILKSIGWSNDGEKFLFFTEDNQIAYYDQTKNSFRYPYRSSEEEMIGSACWHSTDAYILFSVTASQTPDRTDIRVIDTDGQNYLTILETADQLPADQSVDTEAPLICTRDDRLIISSMNRENKSFPYSFFTAAYN